MLVAAVAEDASLMNWLNAHRGLVTHQAVAESLGLQLTAAAKALTQNGWSLK
jgi:alanine dehydrogenase